MTARSLVCLVFFLISLSSIFAQPTITSVENVDGGATRSVCSGGVWRVAVIGTGFVNSQLLGCRVIVDGCFNVFRVRGTFVSSTKIYCEIPRRPDGGSLYFSLTATNDGTNYSPEYQMEYYGESGWLGPVFLTGHDPDFHAQGSQGARNLLRTGLSYVTRGDWNINNGKKFLWVQKNMPPPSGYLDGEYSLRGAMGLQRGVHYDWVTGVDLDRTTNRVNLFQYTAIAVASTFGGLLTHQELRALIARKREIESFIKSGGGLFASSESLIGNAVSTQLQGITVSDLYSYLPVVIQSVGGILPYIPTNYGTTVYGLAYNDLNDPTHNSFGLTGGLQAIDYDSSPPPGPWITTIAGTLNPCPYDCHYPHGVCECGGCVCRPGYTGDFCECQIGQQCSTICGNSELNSGEQCDSYNPDDHCTACRCEFGYEPTDPPSTKCRATEASSGLVSPNTNVTAYQCVPDCSISNNCNGHGTCIAAFTCTCEEGYYEPFCDAQSTGTTGTTKTTGTTWSTGTTGTTIPTTTGTTIRIIPTTGTTAHRVTTGTTAVSGRTTGTTFDFGTSEDPTTGVPVEPATTGNPVPATTGAPGGVTEGVASSASKIAFSFFLLAVLFFLY